MAGDRLAGGQGAGTLPKMPTGRKSLPKPGISRIAAGIAAARKR
jgi:hypothetical protein